MFAVRRYRLEEIYYLHYSFINGLEDFIETLRIANLILNEISTRVNSYKSALN